MKRLLNLIRLAMALYRVRCLEIELHDRTESLRHVATIDLSALCASRRQTQRELAAARQRYISLLAPGDCPTWRSA